MIASTVIFLVCLEQASVLITQIHKSREVGGGGEDISCRGGTVVKREET